jgi:hypothetical protein
MEMDRNMTDESAPENDGVPDEIPPLPEILKHFFGPGYTVTVDTKDGVTDVAISTTTHFVHRLDSESLDAQCATEQGLKTLASRLMLSVAATSAGAAQTLRGRADQITK